MKLILGVLALILCVLLGFRKSGSLTKNVIITESLISFFTEYRNKVEYTEDTVYEIVDGCAEEEKYEFIFRCREYMKEYDFPVAWKKTVEEMPACFPENDKMLLLNFGAKIGTSDKRSQISLVDYLIFKLNNSLEEKKEKEKKGKKLYAFCGVAAGMTAFITII